MCLYCAIQFKKMALTPLSNTTSSSQSDTIHKTLLVFIWEWYLWRMMFSPFTLFHVSPFYLSIFSAGIWILYCRSKKTNLNKIKAVQIWNTNLSGVKITVISIKFEIWIQFEVFLLDQINRLQNSYDIFNIIFLDY